MDGPSDGRLAAENLEHNLDLKHPFPVQENYFSDEPRLDAAVDKLVNAFDKSLLDDDQKTENAGDLLFYWHGHNFQGERIETEESDLSCNDSAATSSVKSLSRSATFPVTDFTHPASNDESKADSSCIHESASCSRSVSLPSPRKLVPAVKGSREKEGAPPRKLSVSWAPDVYDPVPSSVSHLPKKKSPQQYKHNRKHGKGKHKSKNSKASGGSTKDKKHRSSKVSVSRAEQQLPPPLPSPLHKPTPFYSLDRPEKPILLSSNGNSPVGLLDFDTEVDSPDSNCGSSFLRRARSALHIPYAEAT